MIINASELICRGKMLGFHCPFPPRHLIPELGSFLRHTSTTEYHSPCHRSVARATWVPTALATREAIVVEVDTRNDLHGRSTSAAVRRCHFQEGQLGFSFSNSCNFEGALDVDAIGCGGASRFYGIPGHAVLPHS